ncbi:MAG: tetratricopeptide repeat protein [Bacteroidota bacterium]
MFEDENEEYDGNFNEDLERFEKSLTGEFVGFMDSDQLEFIIDHYLINGNYSKAIVAAELGISQFAFNPLFYLRKAQAISAIGQLKEAMDLLAHVEKMEIPSCEFFLTKAAIFSQLRDSKRSIKYFKEALKLSEKEDRDEIYLDLALEYEAAGDFQEAIGVLLEAIKLNPHNEGAIYELAFCYDQTNDLERAIKCYSDFIDENPYSFTAWYNLGNAYSKQENLEKAVWAYDYCLLINDEFSPAYFNMGNAYLSLDKYQLSIENFEKCMEIDGEDGLALCYIGECYEQLENYELAKHYYHRSIDFIPDLPEAWLGLGIVADLEGNTIEGIKLILKAIELDPQNGSFYHVIAGAYEKIEDFEQAKTSYLLSLELENFNEEALTDFIEFLIETNEVKEAIDFLEEYEIGSKLVMTKELLLVNLLYLSDRIDEAVLILISCIAVDENEAKKLFSFYPTLESETKFVNLFS